MFGIAAAQEFRRLVRYTRRLPLGANPEMRMRQIATDMHRDVSASRNGGDADQQHVEQQLHIVLADGRVRRVPSERRLLAFHQSLGDRLRVAEIEFRTGRPGGAESEPCELQLGGSLRRALRDEFHRMGTHLGIVVVCQHLEPVGDRSDRADHVVADAAAEKCRQFQRRNVACFAHARSPHSVIQAL